MRSCSCLQCLNKTRNLSLLPLWTVSASQGPVPIPASINPNRSGNLSLFPLWTVSAGPASIPGQIINRPVVAGAVL